MMAVSTKSLWLGVSIISLIYFLKKYWPSRNRTRYPPGPRALPLIGSKRITFSKSPDATQPLLIVELTDILDIPTDCLGPALGKFGEKYGPLSWLFVPGRNILVLNDYGAMRDLLDKRSGTYNDRPQSVMLLELVGERCEIVLEESYY